MTSFYLQYRRLLLAVMIFTLSDAVFGSVDANRLDGVKIQAVENYKNANSHIFNFGLGVYPLNPYYNAFSLDGSYLYFINKKWGWEIVRGSYAQIVKTDLTSQLAEDYGVNPKSIEQIKYAASTNVAYVFAYGKLLLGYSYIRYFRLLGIFGGGVIGTNQGSSPSVNFGVRSDLYINDTFSWTLSALDQLTTKNVKNYLSFNTGFAISL
ncbi:MAG: hypothetical protein HQK54_09495 [Oligoflexales bacterium]|nr:hypothetical protein [Oligoflexales bacterium]